jgi:hypothetical protein
MKCIACGREMIDRGTHFECSNMLCDYEETIDAQVMLRECGKGVYQRDPACRCALSTIAGPDLVLFI